MDNAVLGMALSLARSELRGALDQVKEAGEILLDNRTNPDGALALHRAVLRLASATEAFSRASHRYLDIQNNLPSL